MSAASLPLGLELSQSDIVEEAHLIVLFIAVFSESIAINYWLLWDGKHERQMRFTLIDSGC